MKREEALSVGDSRSHGFGHITMMSPVLERLRYGIGSSVYDGLINYRPSNRSNSRQARERHAYFAQLDTHIESVHRSARRGSNI